MNKNNHGGNLNYYSEKYNIPLNFLVDFSANINPLGPPKEAFEKIANNLNRIKDYPEPDSENLRSIASDKTGVEEKNIILGNGATELLFLVLNQLKPKNVFIPFPTFSEYELASRSVNSEVNYFPLIEDFQVVDTSFLKDVSKGDIVFLCNPNNPTGSLFEREEIISYANLINEKGAYLILDESFTDFLDGEYSIRNKIPEIPNLIILYSLTKIYSIPGLRLGILIGNADLINSLYKLKDPWNVNILAQLMGEDLLRDKDFLKKTKSYFSNERERFWDELKKNKLLKTYKPSANFVFIEILNDKTVEELQEFLIKDLIMIRNCSNYVGLSNRFFRIAIKSKEENDRLINALSRFFC